ncbi:MAG: transketolase C-terminal domain-containing protein, partial [Paracoccaceae bacterium]
VGISGDGTDLAIVRFGNGIYKSNQANRGISLHGISTPIIDAHWLSPLPKSALSADVQGCKRILIVDETRHSGGVAEALMAHFHETTSARLARVTAEDSFIATGPAYAATMPSAERIARAALELCR